MSLRGHHVHLDEDVLDELLEDYMYGDADGGGIPTSQRVLEAALAANAAEMIEQLQGVIALLAERNVADPATRADLIQHLGKLRVFLLDADRILRATSVSGILAKVSPPERETG